MYLRITYGNIICRQKVVIIVKKKTFMSSDNLPLKCLILIAFTGIIIFPQTAFTGAITGIKLWGATIFPALFPAFIITGCIIRLFPMNSGLSYIYIILSGLLCGYPLGAYLCGTYHSEHPDENISSRLAAFCNISSPSFVINYIVNQILYEKIELWKILLCIYTPVIECLVIIMFIHHKDIFCGINKNITTKKQMPFRISDIIDSSITDAVNNMLKLAGYIIIFSCLSQYIMLLPINNPVISTILCSITEITNGIFLCSRLNIDTTYICIIITAVNAFGGISTLMQTAGITRQNNINIKSYLYGKIILTIVSIANAMIILLH